MATDPQEKLRRLLAGSIPFPAQGRVWLVDTGLEFLAREALDALGSERVSVVERDLVTARRLAAALPALSVAHAPRALPDAGDLVVLPLDKDRRALFGALAALATRVGPAGCLALYGARREGIEPALRYLADFCTLAPPWPARACASPWPNLWPGALPPRWICRRAISPRPAAAASPWPAARASSAGGPWTRPPR